MSERGGKQVEALGERYTALSWYLGVANPTPKSVKRAKTSCSQQALELKGCHCRSLEQQGFVVTPPAEPRSLTGDRVRLGSNWVDTELQGVRIRRPVDGELQSRLSQVLFRTADLQKEFTG